MRSRPDAVRPGPADQAWPDALTQRAGCGAGRCGAQIDSAEAIWKSSGWIV